MVLADNIDDLSDYELSLLKGGGSLHYLLEVDTNPAVTEALKKWEQQFRSKLRSEKARYKGLQIKDMQISVTLMKKGDLPKAKQLLNFSSLDMNTAEANPLTLNFQLKNSIKDEIVEMAVKTAVHHLETSFSQIVETPAKHHVRRVGETNHIVIQLPVGKGPEWVNRTKRLTFNSHNVFSLHQMYEKPSADGKFPSSTMLLEAHPLLGLPDTSDKILVSRREITSLLHLRKIELPISRTGKPSILLKLNEVQTQKLAKWSGETIALIFKGQVVATLKIQDPFISQTATIQGNWSLHTASELVDLLLNNQLPNPISYIDAWVTPKKPEGS
jgi:preprotein translocase subunit SecD